jgi:hypothetical protein
MVLDKRRYRTVGKCEHSCHGHGKCNQGDHCDCWVGLSGDPYYTGADCSLRACPKGHAWGHEAMVTNNDAHLWMECSNRGICDRDTGVCDCYEPFEGHACQRNKCWNDCNGRGLCLPQRMLAEMANHQYDSPWDAMKLWGCFCDVGFRGPGCSLHECPSMADPIGGFGNEAGRDCSDRGHCQYKTGECKCFEGFHGAACNKMSVTF